MVLTDDNYRSIVSAVEQGRIIYSNIRKFVYFLLSANVAEIVLIFVATSLGLGSPLTPIQLLWLNLVTDGAPALALGVEKGDPDCDGAPAAPARRTDHRPQYAYHYGCAGDCAFGSDTGGILFWTTAGDACISTDYGLRDHLLVRVVYWRIHRARNCSQSSRLASSAIATCNTLS